MLQGKKAQSNLLQISQRFGSERRVYEFVWCALAFVTILGLAGPQSSQAKQSVTIYPSGSTSWQQRVEFQKRHSSFGKEPKVVPFMPGPAPREIGGGSGRVTRKPISPPSSGSKQDKASSLSVTRSFQALDDNNTSIPPDTMGAAGPSHLMTMLNSQVRVQDKQGGILSTLSLETFWTVGTGLTGDPFDPRLIFDSLSNRWMAAVDADSGAASSAVWFAVSDGDDPTGGWTFYGIDADATDTNWADFPELGVNSTWVAITNNMFPVAGDDFAGAKMWVFDKSALGGAVTVTEFATGFDTGGGDMYTSFALRPCVTFDASEPTLYIVDQSGWSVGGVYLHRLSRITGSGPSPSWSTVPGSTTVNPDTGWFFVENNYNYIQINASQLGTPTRIDTNDPRILNAVFRNGHVWYAHSAGLPVKPSPSDRTAVFWYEADPISWSGSPASPLVQSGVVDGGEGVHHFFPSIAVNQDNDVALGFSRSDANRYAEAVVTTRLSGDPVGTTAPITVIKAGEDHYVKTFASGEVRWGDYSATVVDPADDLSFWTLQEYAATDVGGAPNDDRWGTWWALIREPGSPVLVITPIYDLLLNN